MYKFDFSKDEMEKIKDKALLNEELCKLLEYKIRGYEIVKIARLMNMSEASVSRRTKKLVNKIKKVI